MMTYVPDDDSAVWAQKYPGVLLIPDFEMNQRL
jgi:hypothetical protein